MGIARRKGEKAPKGRSTLAAELIARNKKAGIPPVREPDFGDHGFPETPADITSLHDKDLSALYGRFDAFAAYVATSLAESEVNSLEVALKLKDVETTLNLEALEDKTKVTATKRKYEAYLDDEAMELRHQDLRHKAEVKLLKARLEGLERSIRVLSREQSRREKLNDRRN